MSSSDPRSPIRNRLPKQYSDSELAFLKSHLPYVSYIQYNHPTGSSNFVNIANSKGDPRAPFEETLKNSPWNVPPNSFLPLVYRTNIRASLNLNLGFANKFIIGIKTPSVERDENWRAVLGHPKRLLRKPHRVI